MLNAVKKIDELNSDQIEAANKRNAAAFAAAASGLRSTQDELVAASLKAGVADWPTFAPRSSAHGIAP